MDSEHSNAPNDPHDLSASHSHSHGHDQERAAPLAAARETGSQAPHEPTARPAIAPPDYGFPREAAGFLPWPFALELLEQTRIYWLATTYPDGRPHLAPLWGVWVEGVFYFDGGSSTRWARNLAANPAAAMHLERGQAVVIVDGRADYVQLDARLSAKIVQAWDTKYGRLHPKPVDDGIFRLRPRTARGWSTEDLTDGTRWQFDGA
ncbi:MAG TPA: pyridoxamine 5'-phosphate oxidase family protein [Ktedonobacterales bacterium]|nr:pyridoxamine 5'-phosphate oxidase family protein [Ktedonobacterales bacterium]